MKDGNLAYNLPPENFALKKAYDPDGNLLSEQYAYTGEQIYLHHKPPYKIVASNGGYLWKGTSGEWKRYDAQGRLLSSGGRYGTIVSTLYNAEGKVSGYANREGTQVIWFDYNADGRIAAVRDAGGRQISYTYDSNGRLWTAMDVLNKETTYSYDDQGWLTQVAKPGGRESNITYDISGNVMAVTDKAGQGYTFAYDYDDRKNEYYTMITSPSGRIKEVWYDEEGRTKQVDINGETVQAIVKEDNALLITDEDGEVTRKEYNEWGNLTKVIYPDGSAESYEYEHTHHRWTKTVDKDGTVTRYEWDEATGHLLRETRQPAGTEQEQVTEYTYDANDRRKTITVKGDGTTPDAVTTYEYDAAGNLVTIFKPDGSTIEFTYDDRGKAISKKDKFGEWKYIYNDLGHLIKIEDPWN